MERKLEINENHRNTLTNISKEKIKLYPTVKEKVAGKEGDSRVPLLRKGGNAVESKLEINGIERNTIINKEMQ